MLLVVKMVGEGAHARVATRITILDSRAGGCVVGRAKTRFGFVLDSLSANHGRPWQVQREVDTVCPLLIT